MKLDKKKLEIYIPLALILSFLLYAIINDRTRKDKWANSALEKRYAIATITKFRRAGKSPDWFNYYFTFDKKLYKDRHSILSEIGLLTKEQQEKFVGRKYFVKFIINDPSYSKLLIKKEVPVNIKTVPLNGWVKLPD